MTVFNFATPSKQTGLISRVFPFILLAIAIAMPLEIAIPFPVGTKDRIFALFVIIVALLGGNEVIWMMSNWWRQWYWVEIDRDKKRGRNLFSSKYSTIPLDSIHSVGARLRGHGAMITTKEGRTQLISPEIDFHGFLIDRLRSLVAGKGEILREEKLKKTAGKPGLWTYGRRKHYDTGYPPGYFGWFDPIRKQQLEEQFGRGWLKGKREDYLGKAPLGEERKYDPQYMEYDPKLAKKQ